MSFQMKNTLSRIEGSQAFLLLYDYLSVYELETVMQELENIVVKSSISLIDAANIIKGLCEDELLEKIDIHDVVKIIGVLSDLGFKENIGIIISDILYQIKNLYLSYLCCDENEKIRINKMINEFLRLNITMSEVFTCFEGDCGKAIWMLIDNKRKNRFNKNSNELFKLFYLGYSFKYLKIKFVVNCHEKECIRCNFYNKDTKTIDTETFNIEQMTALKTYLMERK